MEGPSIIPLCRRFGLRLRSSLQTRVTVYGIRMRRLALRSAVTLELYKVYNCTIEKNGEKIAENARDTMNIRNICRGEVAEASKTRWTNCTRASKMQTIRRQSPEAPLVNETFVTCEKNVSRPILTLDSGVTESLILLGNVSGRSTDSTYGCLVVDSRDAIHSKGEQARRFLGHQMDGIPRHVPHLCNRPLSNSGSLRAQQPSMPRPVRFQRRAGDVQSCAPLANPLLADIGEDGLD